MADTAAARAGERVAWLIPTDYVVLTDGAGAGGANVVTGTLSEITRLGERCMLTLQLGEGRLLRLTLAMREVRERGLAPGGALAVCLLPQGIHLMPPARLQPG